MVSSRAAGGAAPRALPFRHVRLAAYFGLLAALGLLTGWLRLRQSDGAVPLQRAEWILATSVLGVAALGFAGVLIHRLRVLPLRWQETQNYLKAIQRESEKYRLLMEGAADMLVLIDPATRKVREWNARAREGLGLSQAGAQAPSLDALLDSADLARLDAGLDAAAKAGAQAVPIGELHLRAQGGAILIADARLAAIALEDERVVLLSLRDVTRQKEIEKELQVRDRLATLGLLTAGVAHEVNNPLEGIANYLRLAARDGIPAQARAGHLDQVRHGFERIREIVRQLLQFARPSAQMGAIDLCQIVDRARKLAASGERARGLEFVTRGLERPIELVGDAGGLEQVVINLILNAAAAMQGRGRIELTARSVNGSDGAPGVELAVEDEGPGIPPEHLERLFDPFFSTHGGTGLGLSVSLGIVRAHGGTLSASNRPSGGARFAMQLPVRGAQ
jgi:PAS domain S-box-containing protein